MPTEYAPLAVGLPEMTPVVAATVSPGGSCPAVMLQLYGALPPVAASVDVYAAPTVPCGSVVVAIAREAAVSVLGVEIVTVTGCDS
jgi:hypothetical protein